MVVKIERVLLLNGFVEIKEVEPHIVNVEHEQPGVNDFGDEPADHEIASENILKLLWHMIAAVCKISGEHDDH